MSFVFVSIIFLFSLCLQSFVILPKNHGEEFDNKSFLKLTFGSDLMQDREFTFKNAADDNKPYGAKIMDGNLKIYPLNAGKNYDTIKITDVECGDITDINFNDVNGDGTPEIIFMGISVIGAGPQAGMEIASVYIFEMKNGKYENSKLTKLVNNSLALEKLQTANKITEYLIAYNKTGADPVLIGQELPKNESGKYNLKEGERLVLAINIPSKTKILSIALAGDLSYIIYRFGQVGKVELEIKEMKDQKLKKFEYIQSDNYGYTRSEMRSLKFRNGDFMYRVYDNMDEHQKEDGTGIVITNLKTKKNTIFKGVKISGKLGDLMELQWLTKTSSHPNDYKDEK